MSDDKPKSIFLIGVEYIPLLTGMIITLGCFRLLSYYNVFQLSIFDFTEFSDFVSQGITDLFSILLYLFIGFSVTIPAKNPFKNEVENGTVNHNILQENSSKLLKIFEYFSFFAVGAVPVYSIIIFIRNEAFTKYDLLYLFSGVSYGMGIFFGVQLARFYVRTHFDKINKVVVIFIPIITIYFMNCLWFNYTKGLEVKYTNLNIGNSITIGKEVILSTKDYYYIGQTKGFVFFHNEQTNKNDIYPKSQISKMTLSQ